MFYIGNFNYDDANDSAENYCLMPVIVQADDPEDALSKMAGMFEDVRSKSDLLDGAGEIYLDSLIELEQIPTEPLLTQWTKIVPAVDGLSMVSAVLPTEDSAEAAEAYSWQSGDAQAADDSDEEEGEEEPFLTLE